MSNFRKLSGSVSLLFCQRLIDLHTEVSAGLFDMPEHFIALVTATITSTKQLGMGDRACLDTCTQMTVGEGILVGNTAAGFFLVHSESIDNPYVASRPFRVNAGAVHAYTLTPGGKTKYLADLKAGDEVLLVDFQGKSQT
ncbi:unnamed protein product, partial [marine sediment metagenome]